MINGKLIIGHRGASFYERENTLDSFKLAVRLNADMIELDIRKTSDDEMIVFHNDRIGEKNVKEMSYEEINNILGYSVSKFIDVLKYFRGITKLDVHLKESGYEEEAVRLILKYFDLGDFFICSEIPESLEKIKNIFPEVKTGLILGSYFKDILSFIIRGFSKRGMLNSSIDILIPRWQLTNRIVLNKAKKYNKKIIPWSVDNKKTAEKFLKQEVITAIITNKPDFMNK
jgi:glycerophosphoryl diester phosphodiesterase